MMQSWCVKYVTSSSVCLYLREGARGLPDHPDNPQRDADHGGRSHEPADTITPVRVGVHIVVLQRFVLNQEKQENSLQHTKKSHFICELHFYYEKGTKTFHMLSRWRVLRLLYVGCCTVVCVWLGVLGATHSTDAGGQNHPAPLDEEDRFVANHVLDI